MFVLFIVSTSFSPLIQLNSKTKLIVYYFHLTNRCHTCTSIETTTVNILNEKFKTELDNEIIVFKSINVDDKANEVLCKKYEAYGSTLALTKMKDGKELKTEDLTNMAFSKINKPDLFSSELIGKINEMLK